MVRMWVCERRELFGDRAKDIFYGRERASEEMLSLLGVLLEDSVPPPGMASPKVLPDSLFSCIAVKK